MRSLAWPVGFVVGVSVFLVIYETCREVRLIPVSCASCGDPKPTHLILFCTRSRHLVDLQRSHVTFTNTVSSLLAKQCCTFFHHSLLQVPLSSFSWCAESLLAALVYKPSCGVLRAVQPHKLCPFLATGVQNECILCPMGGCTDTVGRCRKQVKGCCTTGISDLAVNILHGMLQVYSAMFSSPCMNTRPFLPILLSLWLCWHCLR